MTISISAYFRETQLENCWGKYNKQFEEFVRPVKHLKISYSPHSMINSYQLFRLKSFSFSQFDEKSQDLYRKTISKDISVTLTSDGCGGAYLLQQNDNKTPFSIFKPQMEEFMAPENPRGYRKKYAIIGLTNHPTQRGFKIGTGAIRECAAYLLDALYNNFSGVPITTMGTIEINGVKKEGSIQAFQPSVSSAEDMGTFYFDPVFVQKIGILDIRLCNADRHAGNILLSKKNPKTGFHKMTPIDHGFCLPSYKHLGSITFEWLNWPQTRYPFHSEALDHIQSLNPDNDAQILRKLGIEEDCITTMRLGTTFLKIGANNGLTLHTIGKMMVREGDGSKPSLFEELIFEARTKISYTVIRKNRIMGDELLKKIIPLFIIKLSKVRNKKPRSSSFIHYR